MSDVDITIALQGIDVMKSQLSDLADAASADFKKIADAAAKSSGDIFGPKAVDPLAEYGPKLSKFTAGATEGLERGSNAAREFREALHLIHLPLAELGIPLGHLRALSYAAGAGFKVLGGIVAGSVLAYGLKQLVNYEEASRKAQERLEGFTGSTKDATEVWDTLSEGNKKLGGTTADLVPAYESLRQGVQKYRLEQEKLLGTGAEEEPSQKQTAEAVTTLKEAFENAGLSASEASKAVQKFFDGFKENGKLTKKTIQDAIDIDPGAANKLAEALNPKLFFTDEKATAAERLQQFPGEISGGRVTEALARIKPEQDRINKERIPEGFGGIYSGITDLLPTAPFVTQGERQRRLQSLLLSGIGDVAVSYGAPVGPPPEEKRSVVSDIGDFLKSLLPTEQAAHIAAADATKPPPTPSGGFGDFIKSLLPAGQIAHIAAAEGAVPAADKADKADDRAKAEKVAADKQAGYEKFDALTDAAGGLATQFNVLKESAGLFGSELKAQQGAIELSHLTKENELRDKQNDLTGHSLDLQQQQLDIDKAHLPITRESLELERDEAHFNVGKAAARYAQLSEQDDDGSGQVSDATIQAGFQLRAARIKAEQSDLAAKEFPEKVAAEQQKQDELNQKREDEKEKVAKEKEERPVVDQEKQLAQFTAQIANADKLLAILNKPEDERKQILGPNVDADAAKKAIENIKTQFEGFQKEGLLKSLGGIHEKVDTTGSQDKLSVSIDALNKLLGGTAGIPTVGIPGAPTPLAPYQPGDPRYLSGHEQPPPPRHAFNDPFRSTANVPHEGSFDDRFGKWPSSGAVGSEAANGIRTAGQSLINEIAAKIRATQGIDTTHGPTKNDQDSSGIQNFGTVSPINSSLDAAATSTDKLAGSAGSAADALQKIVEIAGGIPPPSGGGEGGGKGPITIRVIIGSGGGGGVGDHVASGDSITGGLLQRVMKDLAPAATLFKSFADKADKNLPGTPIVTSELHRPEGQTLPEALGRGGRNSENVIDNDNIFRQVPQREATSQPQPIAEVPQQQLTAPTIDVSSISGAFSEVAAAAQSAASALSAIQAPNDGGGAKESGYYLGGLIRLIGGGRVLGPGTSTSDSIPAMLSDGEFVHNARAVDHYGVNFMHAINEMRVPKEAMGGLIRHLADGGFISTITVPDMHLASGGVATSASFAPASSAATPAASKSAFTINLGGKDYEMEAPHSTVEAFKRAALDRQKALGGRLPSWY